ncbi:phospholipase D family protein, partial [Vibrio parahaemolyticus V-223/04]
ARACTQRQ